ncbi:MAG: amino acid adenylation domain-containing protein, partial [Cyanobacteria bacterium J06614_10]
AELWSALLDVSPVGIESSFFELGGHSLLAMQLLSRIQQQFEVQLSIGDLFAQPTISHLASLIQSGEHRAVELPEIPIVERGRPLPVSIAQQRIWLLEQIGDLGATYHIALRLEISGELQRDVLNQGLALLIERHEALRTTFHMQDSQPVQVIHESLPCQVEYAELSSNDDLEEVAQAYAQQPFDLESGPLLRIKLFQRSSQQQMLVFVVHHIIADGWSVGVLIQEMMHLYPPLLAGQSPTLSDLAVQPVDFAQWQRQWLQGEVLQQQLDYWQRQLEGAAASLALPTDRPRQNEQSFKGEVLSIAIPKTLSQQLNRFSQQQGISLYMTLLSAFGVLLHRYSGQTDILIGSPIANRAHPQVQELIGLFLNTLVLRLDCENNPRFSDFLQQAQWVTLDAYAHQDVPFERLLENLPPEQQRSASPWFQVMFILQNAHRQTLDLEGVEVEAEMIDMGVAKFDITLSMTETDAGLVGEWEYNSGLFERATVERMAAHFEQILQQLVADAQQPIDAVPLLNMNEQQQVQSLCVSASFADEPLRPVHEWFEQQVVESPNAAALTASSSTWSYARLNRRANQIARHLQSVGVGENHLVALCLERSPELIAALLAVLKVGAAYLPMDPSYPAERLHQMVEDAQVAALVTKEAIQSQLSFDVAQVVDIDDAAIQEQLNENLSQSVSLEQRAYVIFTSGSTGRPKGTELTHRGLANFVQQSTVQYGFGSDERVLQFASISFDAAVEEIYLTLCSGGALILRDDEMIVSSETFCRVSAEQQLTVWDLPTAFWHRLTQDIAQGLTELPDSLRIVIIGGEKVQPQIVQQWQQIVQGRNVRLLNTYGPTEATVVAAFYEVDSDWQYVPGVDVPIGRPLGNVEGYILDAHMQLAPLGVAGELYLGGPGLAAGYLNRPELTAERFIAHPYDTGDRLYRTGDLAKMSADGNLHYLGRADDQVKIRGFRVELGEVEAALSRYPGVQNAVVLARENEPGKLMLCAYIVCPPGVEIEAAVLRRSLKQTLPDYMVPSYVVNLDELPLTRTGKVDRKALPAPDSSHLAIANEYVAPRNEIETTLAELWSALLDVSPVGIESSFFELGGH